METIDVVIAGQVVTLHAIRTGLTADPFACEPVIAEPHACIPLDALGLGRCREHDHYRGTTPPAGRCSTCWRLWNELQRNLYVARCAAPPRLTTIRVR
jgi:hypothetical protein